MRGRHDPPTARPDVSGSTTAAAAVLRRLEERGLSPRWLRAAPPDRFGGISTDSRTTEPGDLFCAIPGLRTDGHRYVAEAARRGAAAAAVERAVEGADGLPLLGVSDTRLAAAHLATLFHGDPGESLRVAGVTGTNGKTTTVWILRQLLAAGGPAASVGTLGVVDAEGRRRRAEAALTTPGPVELMSTLAGLRDEGVRHVALELSSHALDQRRADGLPLECAVFTNLSREHLEYHPDMEAYRAAKLRAARLVRPEGACVVNADEPAWEELDPGPAELIRYGISEAADVRAAGLRYDGFTSSWRLVAGGEEAEVRLPLPGEHNVHNALAAAAVALREGIDPAEVARRLGRVEQVPGRMELLAEGPPAVVRDYAHTPEALRRALATLRTSAAGRLVVVFGCGGERDPGKRPLMGEAAADLADLAIVTTDNPRSEDPAEIARRVVEGLDRGRYEVVLDRREAIARALGDAGPGDVVLLAGKGHETYQDFGDRREPFDEARIVGELTGEAGGAERGAGEEGRP